MIPCLLQKKKKNVRFIESIFWIAFHRSMNKFPDWKVNLLFSYFELYSTYSGIGKYPYIYKQLYFMLLSKNLPHFNFFTVYKNVFKDRSESRKFRF